MYDYLESSRYCCGFFISEIAGKGLVKEDLQSCRLCWMHLTSVEKPLKHQQCHGTDNLCFPCTQPLEVQHQLLLHKEGNVGCHKADAVGQSVKEKTMKQTVGHNVLHNNVVESVIRSNVGHSAKSSNIRQSVVSSNVRQNVLFSGERQRGFAESCMNIQQKENVSRTKSNSMSESLTQGNVLTEKVTGNLNSNVFLLRQNTENISHLEIENQAHFSDKENLENIDTAKLSVSTEKPYKCDTCFRSFAQRNNLSRHQMSHTAKSHKCSVCGRCFKEDFYLQMHMKIHSEDTKLVCEICQNQVKREELQTHMNTHYQSIVKNPSYERIGHRVKELLKGDDS